MSRLKNVTSRDLPAKFEDLAWLMPPRAIHDEVAYENTLEMIDALTSVPRLSAGQAAYLDTLTILLEAYEAEHDPIDVEGLTPVEVVRHLMQEHDMSASDLGRLLGERSLGAKILSGGRELIKGHLRT